MPAPFLGVHTQERLILQYELLKLKDCLQKSYPRESATTGNVSYQLVLKTTPKLVDSMG
jgi:hypothetical protein